MPFIRICQSYGNHNRYREIIQKDGETIASALRRAGYKRDYPCGGNGTCGKCRFWVMRGHAVLTEEESRLLTKQEIDAGVRLLCRTSFVTDAEIYLDEQMQKKEEAKIESVGVTPAAQAHTPVGQAHTQAHTPIQKAAAKPVERSMGSCFVAADIGTTTIALARIDRRSGQIISSLTMNNSQRQYGGDVISRIKSACEGNAEELQQLVWQDLLGGMKKLGEDVMPDELVISANTTMEHLLMGDSCKGLGVAPFQPSELGLRTKKLSEIWADRSGMLQDILTTQGMEADWKDLEVTVLPGVSAFVGADVVSGICKIGMEKKEKISLYLDLGTNGEIALGNSRGMLAAATAVGPAFEGGNISCGCPGVPGAIYSVSLLGRRLVTHTIGNKRPIGICGTGILELTFELYKMGIIGKDGCMQSYYLERGYPLEEGTAQKPICYTQADVRQLQMAKSAVRSGIELLMKEMYLTSSDIDKVYLAGGLGYKLNAYKAVGIGLIPAPLRDKTVAVGNTSLQGAIYYGMHKSMAQQLEKAIAITKERNLASYPEFEAYYLRYMDFGV